MRYYVITRQHSDGSAFEVLRVYTSLARAQADLALVEGDYGQSYRLHEVTDGERETPT